MLQLPNLSLVVLLFLCFTSGCLAASGHRCIFDQIESKASPPMTSFVRELPRQGRGAVQALTASTPAWGPIRIRFFTEDLNIDTKYCTAADEVRPDFTGETVVCREQDILTAEKRTAIVNQLLPAAVKMHVERLSVETVAGSILVPTYPDGVCAAFTVPSEHRTTGVSDADMVLYAAAGPTGGSTIAWATTCSEHKDFRPAVGMMNFGPRSVSFSSHNVRVAAHEIAHALGFSHLRMVRLQMASIVSDLRGKGNVVVLTSGTMLNKTREHFNCPTATGMELEDEGGSGTANSHWERRNAKDELMAGIAGVGRYTALTLAAFHDMQFYRANFSMAESMKWGRNSGCNLLTQKCVTDGVSEYPDMFCASAREDEMFCTFDRTALGACTMDTYASDVPSMYQYFSNLTVSGRSETLTDLCPIVQEYSNTGCADGKPKSMLGSRVGPSSGCLKGDDLHYAERAVGDICAELSCEYGEVKVRHLDDETWHDCPEGSSIIPKAPFTSGRILCPAYADVCGSATHGGQEGDSGSSVKGTAEGNANATAANSDANATAANSESGAGVQTRSDANATAANSESAAAVTSSGDHFRFTRGEGNVDGDVSLLVTILQPFVLIALVAFAILVG